MGIFSRLLRSGRRSPEDIWDTSRTKTVTAHLLDGDLDDPFALEVAGESHYQDTLWQAVKDGSPTRRSADDRVHLEVIAALMREPTNPHDADAIAVRVNGERVGYLPRYIAPDYVDVLDQFAAGGQIGACRGVVVGGQRLPTGDTASLGIWLDLASPEHVLDDQHEPHRRTGSSTVAYSTQGLVDGKHYTEFVETVKQLKRKKRHAEAIELLWRLIDAAEEEARVESWDVAPWYYEQLAIVFRKEKDDEAELAILDRYADFQSSRGKDSGLFDDRRTKVIGRLGRR